MTAAEILADLKKNGSESIKKVLVKHGAKEPFYGVKVEYLKVLRKKLNANHALALELFDSGISDAMYLAGLISEPEKFTKAQLQKWAKAAHWSLISESTVGACAAESPHARELAQSWINSPKENVATAGWTTLSQYVALTPDDDLDMAEVQGLLAKVVQEIASKPNRVRYCMNGFVISVGCYVLPLVKEAKATAKAISPVQVDMGDTACKVPDAVEYIEKVEAMGRLGRKKKEARC